VDFERRACRNNKFRRRSASNHFASSQFRRVERDDIRDEPLLCSARIGSSIDPPPGYRNYPKPHLRHRRGESYAAGAHRSLAGCITSISSRLQVRDRILADHWLDTRHLSLCGCRYSTAAHFHTVPRHQLQWVANLTGIGSAHDAHMLVARQQS
jgi:hypothetical protein